jgi:ERCC4-type nuclease
MSIIVDYRKGASKELDIPKLLVEHIKEFGVHAEIGDLEFGDFAFEGRGPLGSIMVGIERKSLHDMLRCIDDARLSGHQLIGMKQMYTVRVVILEGHWKYHNPEGWLMEGFNGGTSWGYCRPGGQRQLYSKLYRYLISLQLGGFLVTYSRDVRHTAYNVCEWFHYWQKKWEQHTSLQEMQKLNLPTLNFKPTLVRKWAADIEGVGVKLSDLAERQFRTPFRLANADEEEWLKIPGIGVRTAQSIVREIWGKR